MRVQHLVLLASVAAGAAACNGNDTGGITTTQPPLAYVRYVHAMPDTGIVDVRMMDKVENLNMFQIAYRSATPYQGIQAGSRHMRVFVATTSQDPDPAIVSQVMNDMTQDFTASTYYTVLETGFARAGQTPAQTLKVVQETLPAAPAAGKYAIRLYPAATYAGGLDVYFTADTNAPALGATPIATNLVYGTPTNYIQLDTIGSTANRYIQVYPTGAAVGTATGRVYPYPPDGLPPATTQVPASRWNAAILMAGTAASGATSAGPGARISGSAFTVFYFPPGVTGSQTQSITSTGPLKGVSYAGVAYAIDIRP